MINEKLKLSGALNIVLTDKDGNVKDNREVKNLVVNSGLAYIVSRMVGTSKDVMSHMALGTGTTATDASQTDLISAAGSRQALDSSNITGTNNEKVQYVCTFAPGEGTGAITEAGIFNSAGGGGGGGGGGTNLLYQQSMMDFTNIDYNTMGPTPKIVITGVSGLLASAMNSGGFPSGATITVNSGMGGSSVFTTTGSWTSSESGTWQANVSHVSGSTSLMMVNSFNVAFGGSGGGSGGGDMLCRTVFPVVNKSADDQMSVTWTITLNAA